MTGNSFKTERFAVYKCCRGWGAVVVSDRGILEVILPSEGQTQIEVEKLLTSRLQNAAKVNDGLAKEAADLLTAYFAGKRPLFDLPLDSKRFTPFRKNVYDWVKKIPYGVVYTYGEVAKAIGMPAAARGVGAAMASNPIPIIIPCHRIVGASGQMTGYSAPGGIDTKAWLLRMEGVEIDKVGRIAQLHAGSSR